MMIKSMDYLKELFSTMLTAKITNNCYKMENKGYFI
jgi:hypothetical protein